MCRLLCIVCSMALALLLTGCSNSRQIESAAIIENVSVDRQDGRLVYTFYRLTSGDKPWGISVSAESFEEACKRASGEYIPNLSLSKLELLLISEDAAQAVMKTDLPYVATQPFFSPVAYLTLCDDRTMEEFEKTNRTQQLIEQQLILLKNHNPSVSIDYLSVFNHLAAGREEGFPVAFIYSEKELKVAEYRLYTKKLTKNN